MTSCRNICTISVRIVDVCKIGCIPSEWVSRLVGWNNWALSWWLNGWHCQCPGQPACTSSSSLLVVRNFQIPTRLSIYVSCNPTLRFTWKAVHFFPPVYIIPLSPMAKLELRGFWRDLQNSEWRDWQQLQLQWFIARVRPFLQATCVLRITCINGFSRPATQPIDGMALFSLCPLYKICYLGLLGVLIMVKM